MDFPAGGMQARTLRSELLEAATSAALKSSLETWLQDAGEKKIVGLEYSNPSSSLFTVLILYTE